MPVLGFVPTEPPMPATGQFLTNAITKVELLCNGIVIGNATGFFLRRELRWFLVTNWHVLAGRDPITGQPRHRSGAVPDQCRFYPAHVEGKKLAWSPVTCALNDPFTEEPLWFQHPTEGQNVDIAALPIQKEHIGVAKDFLDPTGYDPNMIIDLGHDLFLPGYPLGLTACGYMPLWKRASLASSLEIGEGINAYFFVDTATREGMSGAPCLAISNWKHYTLDRARNKVQVVERPMSWRLLGVYSGRLNPSDSFEAQIGIVYRDNLIHEILSDSTKGAVQLRK